VDKLNVVMTHNLRDGCTVVAYPHQVLIRIASLRVSATLIFATPPHDAFTSVTLYYVQGSPLAAPLNRKPCLHPVEGTEALKRENRTVLSRDMPLLSYFGVIQHSTRPNTLNNAISLYVLFSDRSVAYLKLQ
jgi:hypothetical protein